jgi:sporulation protein YlmC with PRC-barrel domain
MRKTLFGLTAGLLLAGTSLAIAQTNPAPSPPQESPPAAKTTEPSAPKANEPAATKAATPQQMWYSRQGDEVRASKLIGAKVVNAANETVGDVNEIVLTKDGKITAVVVGVGGFLGIGEREVAVNFSSMNLKRDQSNNLVVSTNATQESLKAAPVWHWDESAKK